jgi:hypothetical protein
MRAIRNMTSIFIILTGLLLIGLNVPAFFGGRTLVSHTLLIPCSIIIFLCAMANAWLLFRSDRRRR